MLCEGVWNCLKADAEAGRARAATRATSTARRVTPNKVRRGARKGQRFLTAREGAVVRGAERVEDSVEHGLGLVGIDAGQFRRRLHGRLWLGLGHWLRLRLGLMHRLGLGFRLGFRRRWRRWRFH